MPVEFNRFSPQSFERLAQALCVHILGPGTIIFGSGPDGGREATFEGKVPFPSSKECWDGYIVVQAKYRDLLRNNSEDADWLCKQLEHDLKKFLEARRSLRKPEYYLLVTNVQLSSVAKSGGKAKVDDVFLSFKRHLNLKGYAVWSADELRTFLDTAETIRRAYAAYLTPSDVLSDLIQSLKRPNLSQLLPLSLARDLRRERDVRLKDAGQETDKAIFLEEVFVDLPLVSVSTQSSLSEKSETTNELIIQRILQRASDKLDPESIDATFGKRQGEKAEPLPNRVVLLGGPGQGKSTLGQFLAQLGRARLLNDRPRSELNPQIRNLLGPIIERAKAEGLPLAGPARFPIRINVPDFADLINSSEEENGPTLLGHIAKRLSEDLDVKISGDDLRIWLGTYPSMIILDGLDEVPPTSNRTQLIWAIDAFWDDLSFTKADALLIVTTRPQGYNHDLDPNLWEHWELATLDASHALNFARRLSEIRLSDPGARKEILTEIESASADTATKALLTSPLQVAILFGIALVKGSIPRDRWELFNRYYELLRDREAQKPHSIVRRYKRQIDMLHQESGFLLHVSAEGPGAASAHFKPDEFRELIVRLLRNENYSEAEISDIAGELGRTATDRLVFLSTRVEGRIAFDIRSLQEFMAAARLTVASDIPLGLRLRSIANSAHWRHVFRIAASKIFSLAELDYYRTDILDICHALDNGDLDEEGRLTRAGARLALELLTDGIADASPGLRKQLLRRALSILDAGPDALPHAIVEELRNGFTEVFQEELSIRLKQGSTLPARAARAFLLYALSTASSWAEEIIILHWPGRPAEALEFCATNVPVRWTTTLLEKLKETQRLAGPFEVLKYVHACLHQTTEDGRSLKRKELFGSVIFPLLFVSDEGPDRNDRNFEAKLLPGSQTNHLSSTVTPTLPVLFRWPDDVPTNELWRPATLLTAFRVDPNSKTLSSLLRELSAPSNAFMTRLDVPWVLSTLLEEIRQGGDAITFSELALQGKFGDTPDWRGAEVRWRVKGFRGADFLVWNGPHYLSSDIAKRGAPYLRSLTVSSGQGFARERYLELLNAADELKKPDRKLRLVEALLFASYQNPTLTEQYYGSIFKIAFSMLEAIPNPAAVRLVSWMLSRHPDTFALSPEFSMRLDKIGTQMKAGRFDRVPAAALINAFNSDIKQRGLLPIIAFSDHKAADNNPKTTITASISDAAFQWEDHDTDSIRLAVAVLKLVSNKWSYADLHRMVEQFCDSKMGWPFSYLIHGITHPLRGKLLYEQLTRGAQLSTKEYGRLVELLAAYRDEMPSSLVDPSERGALKLPLAPNLPRPCAPS